MSTYSDATAAFRETTKWLVAFVPIGALVGTVAVIGPRLVGQFEAGDWPDFGQWLALLAPVAGVVVVIWRAASVLRPTVPELPAIISPNGPQARLGTEAMSEGIGEPYFSQLDDFKSAVRQMKNHAAQAGDPSAEALATITNELRDWVALRTTSAAFRWFVAAYCVGVLLIGGGVVAAAVLLEQPLDAIETPVAVTVTYGDAGRADLLAETGCDTDAGTTFTAIGGTWDRPQLVVAGPADGGCRFRAEWTPDPDDVVVTKLAPAES